MRLIPESILLKVVLANIFLFYKCKLPLINVKLLPTPTVDHYYDHFSLIIFKNDPKCPKLKRFQDQIHHITPRLVQWDDFVLCWCTHDRTINRLANKHCGWMWPLHIWYNSFNKAMLSLNEVLTTVGSNCLVMVKLLSCIINMTKLKLIKSNVYYESSFY